MPVCVSTTDPRDCCGLSACDNLAEGSSDFHLLISKMTRTKTPGRKAFIVAGWSEELDLRESF